MKVGFVHLGGEKGDGVRNRAMMKHLVDEGIEVVDILLRQDGGESPVTSHVTFDNLMSFLSIALGRRQASFLADVRWNGMARRLKRKSIPRWTSYVLERAGSVDLLHAETHIAAYVCAVVKRESGKPFVFDMHGLQVEEAKGRNCPPSPLRLLEVIERIAVGAADCVSVVSPLTKEVIAERYAKPESDFVIIPNGTYPFDRTAEFSRPLRVIFAGNFAPYERVEDFVGLAQLKGGPDYEFFLMGDGELRDQLFSFINRRRIDMAYLFRKSYEKTLHWLSTMQVGIAPVTDSLNGQAASSIKVRDYATCGLPVITPDVGDWPALLTRYDAGIVTEKSSAEQFAEALAQLSDRAVWQRKSANAKLMAKEACLWGDVLTPLVPAYARVLRGQGPEF